MSLSASHKLSSQTMTRDEHDARVNLAALYRLIALYGWDDMLATHISARVPGPEHHFLINPYGLRFCEITASSLVKIDLNGNPVDTDTAQINYAGFVVHSAIHAARDDARWIIHLHTDDGVAVSSQVQGLLPLNQRSLTVLPMLSYHDFEGIALNLEERERLVADLGSTSTTMLLRNHGTLALGPTPGAAWSAIYQLERSCTCQVKALSAGRDGILLAPESAQREVREQMERARGDVLNTHFDRIWQAMLRLVDERARGYAA
jgi:ribulose-5-phosphate 4-epimerase/fuculose-1-phosphate aldolase